MNFLILNLQLIFIFRCKIVCIDELNVFVIVFTKDVVNIEKASTLSSWNLKGVKL